MTSTPLELRYAPSGARLPDPAAPPTPWWLLIASMAAVIIPLIVICQIISVYRADVVDDQMFGYFGWRIAHGGTVYLDVWDNKPPGIYWINAVGFLVGGDSYAGVVAMCVLALVAAHACFFGVCASVYFRGPAAVTTVLLSFFLTHGYYTGGTNRTETFLVALELAGMLCYLRGFHRDRFWIWWLAGFFCGCAFLFKQVGLAAWGAMGLHTLILIYSRDITLIAGLRRGGLLILGAASSVGLAALYLASQGALHAALFATFEFNRAYFANQTTRFPYNYVSFTLLKNHLSPILRLPLLMVLATAIHATLWALRPLLRPAEIVTQLERFRPIVPRPVLLFSMWFLIAAYGAVMSPHGFRHYLVPTIPPMMLLAGYLINVIQTEASLLVRFERRAWVIAAFIAMGWFAWDAYARQWEEMSKIWVYRFMLNQRPEWEIVADAIRANSGPNDRLQCWGYMPGVYLHARRINTCRFTTTEKVGHVGTRANFVMEELERELKARPPELLAIRASDMEWLRGKFADNPPHRLLGPWIDERYLPIADVGTDVLVLKRRDLLPAAPPQAGESPAPTTSSPGQPPG